MDKVLFLYSYRKEDGKKIWSVATTAQSDQRFTVEDISGKSVEDVAEIIKNKEAQNVVINCHCSGTLNMLWGKVNDRENLVSIGTFIDGCGEVPGYSDPLPCLQTLLAGHKDKFKGILRILFLTCNAGQIRSDSFATPPDGSPEIVPYCIDTDFSLSVETAKQIVEDIKQQGPEKAFADATSRKDQSSEQYIFIMKVAKEFRIKNSGRRPKKTELQDFVSKNGQLKQEAKALFPDWPSLKVFQVVYESFINVEDVQFSEDE